MPEGVPCCAGGLTAARAQQLADKMERQLTGGCAAAAAATAAAVAVSPTAMVASLGLCLWWRAPELVVAHAAASTEQLISAAEPASATPHRVATNLVVCHGIPGRTSAVCHSGCERLIICLRLDKNTAMTCE